MPRLKNKKREILIGVILIGILFRLFLSIYGSTYDMKSFLIVGELFAQFKNVYENTPRYNYGPIWFLLIGFMYEFSKKLPANEVSFRYLITLFLTTIDILTTLFLFKRFGIKSAVIFFLNPLSILITGYFSMFDNLSILIGFYAINYLEKNENEFNKNKLIGLILLGLSITIKHILIFYPFWLFFKEEKLKNKLYVLLLPICLFFASFTPFIFSISSQNGIVENVFRYAGAENYPLLKLFTLNNLNYPDTNILVYTFLMFMVIAGIFYKRLPLIQNYLMYLLVFITFAPSIYHYYFAIVISVMSVYPSLVSFVFIILSSYILLLDGNGLNIKFLVDRAPWIFLMKKNYLDIFQLPILLSFFYYIELNLYLYKKTTLQFSNKVSSLFRKK